MEFWTQDQWVAFTGVTMSGVGAIMLLMLGLRAMRGWNAPAPLRLAPAHAIEYRGTSKPAARLPGGGSWTDPMRADYTDPGIGALSSIRAVADDPALFTEHERRTAEDEWVHAYDDLADRMPETAAAAEAMRVAIEPALRKARLWLMQAGETGAKAVLANWRIEEHTGELRNPFAITPRAVASALLES